MEIPEEAKQLITSAKNICIIPQENNGPESITSALALFYTLKELHKNVNLLTTGEFPETLNFLVPSLDFISYPKNFVISIPTNIADISQVYYEKNNENLKIHLTIEKGNIKKEHVSFYVSEAKPDLVITLGIQDFQKQLAGRLDSFGFILDTPIINIDTDPTNTKFGKINLIENRTLPEITTSIIKSLDPMLVKKEVANCLLTGLIVSYDNFTSTKTTPQVFETAAELMKHGADHHNILKNIRSPKKEQTLLLGEIMQNLESNSDNTMSLALLHSDDFQHLGELHLNPIIEKIKTMGMQRDLLVLWKSHASDPMIKGFFYSNNQEFLGKVARSQRNIINTDWVFIAMPGSDPQAAKNNIIASISNSN